MAEGREGGGAVGVRAERAVEFQPGGDVGGGGPGVEVEEVMARDGGEGAEVVVVLDEGVEEVLVLAREGREIGEGDGGSWRWGSSRGGGRGLGASRVGGGGRFGGGCFDGRYVGLTG